MIIRGVWFEDVFVASGGMNFFLDGWPYDRIFEKFMPGYSTEDATKITKTSTFDPRPGFMPLKENLKPLEFKPKCIYINPWSFAKCFMLNAVGLSGPGFANLIERNIWQQEKNGFIISIMAIGKTPEERVHEIRGIVKILQKALPQFRAKIAIELNISCPNTGHDTRKLAKEAVVLLKLIEPLDLPVIVKFNLLMPIDAAVEIAESGFCDAINIPNTYPFDELPEKFRKTLFKNGQSPLKRYGFGSGGYSGVYQTELTAEWIDRAHSADIELPIIAGSVYKKQHVRLMKEVGANAIAIGAAKVLRPWRMKGIIKEAKKYFGG